jgi:hypothetical protein
MSNMSALGPRLPTVGATAVSSSLGYTGCHGSFLGEVALDPKENST